jgi:tRNA dimethylallyltransferase
VTAPMSWPTSALLLISGPTAVGKSELALRLARALDGEILTIDSVQVYRGLDIGSAKPTAEEQSQVPHHLLDLSEPSTQSTVAHFLLEAERALSDVRSRGKLPIFVGGTGLYVTALLQGLAELPAADPELRAALELRETADLLRELTDRDPDSASRLHRHDRVRIVRALEAVLLSGAPASQVRQTHGHQTTVHPALCLIPIIDRELLHERINLRTRRMLQGGLMQEVRGLVRRYGADAPALEAIGYRECVAALNSAAGEEGLEEQIALKTRQFAKRQLTFWRNEPGKRGWAIRPHAGDPCGQVGGISQSRRAPVKPIAALEWNQATLVQEVRARLLQPLENSEVWFLDAGAALAS